MVQKAARDWIRQVRGLLAEVKGKPDKLGAARGTDRDGRQADRGQPREWSSRRPAELRVYTGRPGSPGPREGRTVGSVWRERGPGQDQLNRLLKKIDLPIAVPGDLRGYQAGHLIGTQFGGSGDLENVVPLAEAINLRWEYNFEMALAKAVMKATAAGEEVYADVRAIYDGDLMAQALAAERKWQRQLTNDKAELRQQQFETRKDSGTLEKDHPVLGPRKRRTEGDKEMKAAADAGDYVKFQEQLVATYTNFVRLIPDHLLYSVTVKKKDGSEQVLFDEHFPVEDRGNIKEQVEAEMQRWRQKAKELLVS